MLYEKSQGEPQVRFYVSKCKYCGKTFIKFQNKTCYCSSQCRSYAAQDQKASFARKYRRMIREGLMVRKETYLGTGCLTENPLGNFEDELLRVRKELNRIGVKT